MIVSYQHSNHRLGSVQRESLRCGHGNDPGPRPDAECEGGFAPQLPAFPSSPATRSFDASLSPGALLAPREQIRHIVGMLFFDRENLLE
ncbi:hypothetical protein OKW30_001241 [Paraburkholderia sp. Clong3]